MDDQARDRADGAGRPAVLRSFLEAVDDRVRPTAVSKPALIELCHALEDLVLEEDLAGTVIAGFQRSRFWRAERERYAALVADPRRRALVFTAEDGEDLPGVQRLAVGPDHPVAREWFVITLTAEFSAVLFGRELSRSDATDRAGRQFLTVWSCDPSVVDELLTVLSEALGDGVPGATAALAAARAAHPPRDPAAGMTQRFANVFFERLELVTQRNRSLQMELDEARRVLARLVGDQVRTDGGPSGPPGASTDRPAPLGEVGSGRAQTDQGGDLTDRGRDGHEEARLSVPAAAVGTEHTTDEPRPGAARPNRTTLRALVLHGDPALRGLLEALLRRSGWDVTATNSLDRGLDAIRMTTFDAVLVHVGLVDGDGAMLLEELERVQPDARTRTAFVTDGTTDASEHQGRPVIATPLVWSDLEAVLDSLTATL